MIDSIFILSGQGDIIIDRSFGQTAPRSLAEECYKMIKENKEANLLKPVLSSEQEPAYMFHYEKHNLIYIAITRTEGPSLLFSKFLEHLDLVLCDFFGEEGLGEKVRSQFVYLYMIMDELVDGGFPNITEPNMVKELLNPPGPSGHSAGTVISKTELPSTLTSAIYWRKGTVLYVNNEIFIDINETMNAIFGRDGVIITSFINGEVLCCSKLSGVPTILLNYDNVMVMEDVSVHPCVKYLEWASKKHVMFIPPDGNFTLMKYRAGTASAAVPPPISVRPSFTFSKGSARFELAIAARNTGSKAVEQCFIDFSMPSTSRQINATATQGAFTYDSNKKTARWTVGTLPMQGEVVLTGNIDFEDRDAYCEERPIATISFRIPMYAVSGLKIRSLTLSGPTYKMFKGMRCLTIGGNYEVRM
ncbi:Adaptor protein complex 3 (AP-3), mu subunit [Blattamonas nauphoetae]|uniref:Adaptor protein complex 3 (AP-3), mu subunit n=1 Tax=Blattamonas nauphoetae TaxID=2049346 RepID=A0ABQ9XLP1_9EUKA|nr:Adaptor protein complex 3 (AP-3), mu subunit [Blattamonas nauphoetae]